MAIPVAGSAQQVGGHPGVGAGSGAFPGFDGQSFGFEPARFYRFASGPDGFEPWHQHRQRSDIFVINRVLDIDRIPVLIDAGGIFSTTFGPSVIVTR